MDRNKMHAGAGKLMYQKARELRDKSTHAEDLLWGYLRSKPSGYKFRRQHPYSIYILDFYCHQLKLVIEVDGSIHDDEAVKANDKERQSLLEQDGLTIIRFTNEEITNELEKVVTTIEILIQSYNQPK
jgi:imidazole glycerol-phosphate synthase subunit HisF